MAITISGENNNDRILAQDGVIDQISGINIVGLLTAGHINVGSNIQLGNAGIITATTFVGNVTGNVNSTSPLLLQTGGSERFRITGNNELGIAGANYGSSGQVLTSGGSGSAVSWTTIPTQVTIANNANNRIITGGSGTNLNGEANFTYNGTQVDIAGTTDGVLNLDTTDSRGAFIRFGQGGSYHNMVGCADGLVSGPDKEDLGLRATDNMVFCTGGANERVRITSDGKILIAQTTSNWGTTSANSVIQIKNGVVWDYAGVQLDVGHNYYYNSSGAYKYIRSGYAARQTFHNNTGDIAFWSGGTGSANGTFTWSERLRIASDGQLTHTTNKASGYIATFNQAHADNPGTVLINSPTNSNLRPASIDLAQAGTVKWSIGQVYASTSSQAFHICSGSNSESNSKLTIDAAGRVFIGRVAQYASSSERLSVNGMTSIQYASSSAAALYIFNTDNTTSGNPTQPFIFLHDGNGIRGGLGVKRSTGLTALNGQFGLSLRTGSSGVNGTERLHITTTGAINCGHGSAVNLHGSTTTGINLNGNNNSGQIIANASGNRALIIGRQGSYGQVIEFFQGTNTNEAAVTIPAADTLGFETNGTENFRVTSQGRVRIKCQDMDNDPWTTNRGVMIGDSSTGSTFSNGSATSTANNIIFANGNGLVGKISTNGSTTTYHTSSDYRLKENAVPISDGIARLKTLKPYRFNFKADPSTTLDGFFAHEVSSAVPEAVDGEKDELYTEAYLGYKEGDEKIQTLDPAKLVPLLTAALKDVLTKVETLEARVAALEGS